MCAISSRDQSRDTLQSSRYDFLASASMNAAISASTLARKEPASAALARTLAASEPALVYSLPWGFFPLHSKCTFFFGLWVVYPPTRAVTPSDTNSVVTSTGSTVDRPTNIQ